VFDNEDPGASQPGNYERGSYVPPLQSSAGEPPPPRSSRRGSSTAVNWGLAAVIVMILAVAGGLITAWIVANMKAEPGAIALVTARPTPAITVCACSSPSAAGTVAPTTGPRFTPTAPASPEVTPEPFIHVVSAGESLAYIAGLYQVPVQDIVDLNDIKNPNRIFVGQELLIPGYGVRPTEKPTKPPK
jgi:LysM repeat protein